MNISVIEVVEELVEAATIREVLADLDMSASTAANSSDAMAEFFLVSAHPHTYSILRGNSSWKGNCLV